MEIYGIFYILVPRKNIIISRQINKQKVNYLKFDYNNNS